LRGPLGASYTPFRDDDEFWGRIDPGIRTFVRALNQMGFCTIGSCEGHSDPSDPSFRDGIYRRPTIRIGFRSWKEQGRFFRKVLADACDAAIRFDVIQYPDTHAWGPFASTVYLQFDDLQGAQEFERFLLGALSAKKANKSSRSLGSK